MAKLNDGQDSQSKMVCGLYNALHNVIASPGDHVQLFTPCTAISGTSASSTLLRAMDYRPVQAQVAIRDITKESFTDIDIVSADHKPNKPPGAGMAAFYGDLMSALKPVKVDNPWRTEMVNDAKDNGDNNVMATFDVWLKENNLKTLNYESISSFINSPSYKGAQGDYILALYSVQQMIKPNIWIEQFEAFQELPKDTPWYSLSIQDVEQRLKLGIAAEVNFTNKADSIDTKLTWADVNVSASCGLFSFGSSNTHYEDLSRKFQNCDVTGHVKYGKLLSLPVLNSQEWWFSLPALVELRQDKSYFKTPEDHGKFFGRSGQVGSMVWGTAELVLASDIDVSVAVAIDKTTIDDQTLTVAVNAGFFPMFTASGQGGTTTHDWNETLDHLALSYKSTDTDSMWVIACKVSNIFDQ